MLFKKNKGRKQTKTVVKKPAPKKQEKTVAKKPKATGKPAKKRVSKKTDEVVLLKNGRNKNGEQLYSAVPVYSDIPRGWREINGAMTQPKGYKWICNNKSLFAKDKKGKPLFKQAFVKTNKGKK